MRIAVVGAGAMGCLFGGRLQESGQDVVLIRTDQRHIDAINMTGLRLETDDGDRQIKVKAARAAAVSGVVDWLIVFTKSLHTLAAVQSAAHLVGPATWALTVQNGLGNAEIIATLMPAARIAVGITNLPADMVGPGHVRSHGAGEVKLWTMTGGAHEAIEVIRSALDTAGLPCVADPSIQTAIWEKIAFNAAMNSLAAVTRLNVGALADHADGRALAAAIAHETLAVAEAKRVTVDRERVKAALAHAFAAHRNHAPSMLQDVLAGRRTEIESINGAIVAAAASVGVAVPVTATLLKLVRLIEQRRPI